MDPCIEVGDRFDKFDRKLGTAACCRHTLGLYRCRHNEDTADRLFITIEFSKNLKVPDDFDMCCLCRRLVARSP